jgi:hypothetical protein
VDAIAGSGTRVGGAAVAVGFGGSGVADTLRAVGEGGSTVAVAGPTPGAQAVRKMSVDNHRIILKIFFMSLTFSPDSFR